LDPVYEQVVAERVSLLTTLISDLAGKLAVYDGSTDVSTPEGKVWKVENEDLKRMQTKRYAAKLQAMEDIFGDIDLLVLTLDAFLQLKSGKSQLSEIFAPFEFVLGVVDEVHQSDFYRVYGAALLCSKTLFLLGDRHQYIEYLKYGSKLAADADESVDLAFSWQRCISGGFHMHPWTCAEVDTKLKLNRTWRFGIKICEFLRRTTPGYAIHSPAEFPNEYTGSRRSISQFIYPHVINVESFQWKYFKGIF
jgi:hypothetical protein